MNNEWWLFIIGVISSILFCIERFYAIKVLRLTIQEKEKALSSDGEKSPDKKSQ